MSLIARSWSSSTKQQSSVSRLLVHLPESDHANSLILFAVELARRCEARVRGLTVVDTSQLEEYATTCESAAYAAFEQQRLEKGEEHRDRVRAAFSLACLAAGLDFDLHRKLGRRLEILRGEAKCHDLSLTSMRLRANRQKGEMGSADVLELIVSGVSPLLVLRESSESLQRILLIQDNSAASSRTIRSFLSQGLFPDANVRLLAVGPNDDAAKQTLRDGLDTIGDRLPNLESGYVVGKPAQVVPEYALQWEADLVVVGGQRRLPLVGSLLGETAGQVLNRTPAALYSAG